MLLPRARHPLILAVLLVASAAAPLLAHHSYLMFDGTRTRTVTGTVAKVEWMNPHVYVWVYVPKREAPTKYDLYAFENGSINVLSRLGWSKSSFAAGDKVTVEFNPLKDGRTGGHLTQVTSANGRVLKGAGGPNAPAIVVDDAKVPR
jgi:hypothetical protein